MSYDIELINPVTEEVIELDRPHQLRGGTYALGGTKLLTMNITYNYHPLFVQFLHPDGIHVLHNKPMRESLVLIYDAILSMKQDVEEDYWEPTEGNARKALCALIEMLLVCPCENAVWRVAK